MNKNALTQALGIKYPIIQAPMAGISTVALATAVSEAGGLGSLGLGSTNVEPARKQIRALKAATNKSFNVNFFCHQTAPRDYQKEKKWIQHLTPYFLEFSAKPFENLNCDYRSFIDNDDMLSMLLEELPPVVSFHFGLPKQAAIDALKQSGIYLLGCATSLAEAKIIEEAGLDAIIAQGYEAGGHRGVFNVNNDLQLGLSSLLSLLNKHCHLPIIAAGGIMTGASIASILQLGACAAQIGTAFLLCPESATDESYRANLKSSKAYSTQVTSLISGRPARGLSNLFYSDFIPFAKDLPTYPLPYSLAKALSSAASAKRVNDFSPHWAGQSAPLIREMPAKQLVETFMDELNESSEKLIEKNYV